MWKKLKLFKTDHAFRSGFEKAVALDLEERRHSYEFESIWIPYTVPEQKRRYLPDFILKNGIIIECKGRFLSKDRSKMLLVREQNPDLDIRFVFQNPKVSIRKGSKTTVAMWCDKNNFLWADKVVPRGWLKYDKKRNKKR